MDYISTGMGGMLFTNYVGLMLFSLLFSVIVLTTTTTTTTKVIMIEGLIKGKIDANYLMRCIPRTDWTKVPPRVKLGCV